jgi:hypothetical protein
VVDLEDHQVVDLEDHQVVDLEEETMADSATTQEVSEGGQVSVELKTQEASETVQVDLVPQHLPQGLAEAALEAHLAHQQRAQAALVAVQDLEQQRLHP